MRLSVPLTGPLFVVLSLSLVPAPHARAEDKKSASLENKKGAQDGANPAYSKALAAAMAEHELGNWTEARALFEQAHELNPNARTLRAVGLCAFEEKSYVAAIANLTAALEETRKPLTPEQRTHAEDLLHRSEGFVARYTVQVVPAAATLRVNLRAPVILNGQLLLDPGTHQLSFSAPGYQSAERTLLARPREGGVLKVELTHAATADVTTAPVETRPPATGAKSDSTPQRDGLSGRQKGAIAVAAAGVASLGVGIGYGVIAKNKQDDSGCAATCEDKHSLELNKQASTAGNVATAGYAVGGAALAAAAFMFFWPKPEKPTAVSWRFSPDWSRGPAASVSGSF